VIAKEHLCDKKYGRMISVPYSVGLFRLFLSES